jgi:hypothetical protein
MQDLTSSQKQPIPDLENNKVEAEKNDTSEQAL